MATQEVLKKQIESKEERQESSELLNIETLFNEEPFDELSYFDKNLLKVVELNSRLNFMLAEVKDLIRK